MCGGNDSSAFKHGMIGFLVGAAVGALAALFLTTKSGEELRSDIRHAVMELREKIEETAGKVRDMTKEKYSEIVNNVVESYKRAKDFTQKEMDLIKKILIEEKEV